MCNYDAEPAACSTLSFPKARREHKCCECGLPIPVGEVYAKTTGVWDGSPDTFKQHTECRDLLMWISDNLCDGETWSFGSLREEVGEYSDELTAKFEAATAKYRTAPAAGEG